MSFRQEVRGLMRDLAAWMKSETISVAVLKDVIERQKKEINDLHDKLLARNLPELKTFTLPEGEEEETDYSPGKDPENAGLIADFGGEPE